MRRSVFHRKVSHMRTLIINRNDAGQRLDKFLSKAVKAMPKSLMYKGIRTKKIKVNRKRAEIGYILEEGTPSSFSFPKSSFRITRQTAPS